MATELLELNSLEDYGSPKAYAGVVLGSFMATLWQLAWGQARTLNNARAVLATSSNKTHSHSPFFLIYFCFSLFFLHLQHFALCNICCGASYATFQFGDLPQVSIQLQSALWESSLLLTFDILVQPHEIF